jgi:hypothetical protein
MSSAISALWAAFRDPAMSGLFDVYVAARTDKALDKALAPILEAHRTRILEQAAALLPEVANHRDFELVVDTIVYSMQGVVLGTFGEYDDGRHLRAFNRLAQRELERMLEKKHVADPPKAGRAHAEPKK